MKDYKRLTKQNWHNAKFSVITHEDHRSVLHRLWELENRIESGELCDRKETAREILKSMLNKMYKLTGCGVPYHVKKFIEEIAMEYGVDLEDEE